MQTKNRNTVCKYTHTHIHTVILSAHTNALMLMVMSVVLYISNRLFRALHNNTRVNTSPHLDGTQKTMCIKGCNQESEKGQKAG